MANQQKKTICTYKVGLLYPDPDHPLVDPTTPTQEWLTPTLAAYQTHKKKTCQAPTKKKERQNRIRRKQRIAPCKRAIAQRVRELCTESTAKRQSNVDSAIALIQQGKVPG
ncbi:MAG: hypothetical protein ACXAEL_15815, partial [Candidatus Hodarchaeales archaeon]